MKSSEGALLSTRQNAGELALDVGPSDSKGAALDLSNPKAGIGQRNRIASARRRRSYESFDWRREVFFSCDRRSMVGL